MIRLSRVSKTYQTAAGGFAALRDVDLEVAAGELLVVVGKSGSGKSTLLNMVAGIDWPTTGDVEVNGTSVGSLTSAQLAHWLGRSVGIVFQFFQLLPTLTVLENVMLPMDFLGELPAKQRTARAAMLLDRVGVADQSEKLPAELSGGQQQRVAIARALANDPPVLLADEPTGNLDSTNGNAVLALFAGLAREGKTVLIATHDREASVLATRTVAIVDGAIR